MSSAFFLAIVCAATTGQCAGGRCYQQPTAAYYPAPPAATYYRPAAAAYAATYRPALPQQEPNGGRFLGLLNGWRAQHGRRPVGWDASLAAYASLNNVVGHAPQSRAPGSSQCWASCTDEVTAFYLWVRSPPHASILLNANYAVGVARCPTGMTCNAR